MFKAVDADGNGVLDKTEFIKLAKSDQLRLTRRKVRSNPFPPAREGELRSSIRPPSPIPALGKLMPSAACPRSK